MTSNGLFYKREGDFHHSEGCFLLIGYESVLLLHGESGVAVFISWGRNIFCAILRHGRLS